MSDFSIKPTAGTGNKLIIKDQAGNAVLETSDSGATLANNVTPSAKQLGVLEADMWRLTTSFSGDAEPIASNWERYDNSLSGVKGTGLTQSSGVFTFPSTGWWNVYFNAFGWYSGDSRYVSPRIKVTTDNGSNWSFAIFGGGFVHGVESGNSDFDWNIQGILKIGNVSNDKCRFDMVVNNNSTNTGGHNDYMSTGATFIKLGEL